MSEPLPYQVLHIGEEKQPVVIIDNFVGDPNALVADACEKNFEQRGPYYPGIRAQSGVGFLKETSPLITQILKNEFGVQAGVSLVECNYSLVTTRPEQLMPIQCLPHFDGIDPGRIAVLHYLSKPEQGGTAFYRHKATGYETVTADRIKMFEMALQEEANQHGLPEKKYFTIPHDRYEQIAKVDAKFNRCVIYRGITLHSGDIPTDLAYDDDPATGRLTVNTFLAAR